MQAVTKSAEFKCPYCEAWAHILYWAEIGSCPACNAEIEIDTEIEFREVEK